MEYVIKTGKPYRNFIDAETRNWPIICVTHFGMPEDVRKALWEESQKNIVIKKFKGVSST